MFVCAPTRLRAASLLLVLAGTLAALGSARAQELFCANGTSNSITVYNRTDNGDVAPLRTLSGPSTGLNAPRGIAVDLIHDEIFVTNFSGNSVTVYGRTASGDTAPLRTISGSSTLLDSPVGIAVDTANDELIVGNRSSPTTSTNSSIVVFSRSANGNVAPLRTIAGPASGLNYSHMLMVDTLSNEIFIVNASDAASPPVTASVMVFSRTANGDVAPLRTLSGATTGLSIPVGLALDRTNDEVFVTNAGATSVTVYGRTASGDTAPLRTIGGASTGMNYPVSAYLDLPNQQLLISNQAGNSVTVYNRTDSGDVAPVRTLAGGSTGLSLPGMAVLPAGLVPEPMLVDTAAVSGSSSNVNGLLEPGETVQVAPVWQNSSTIPESFGGVASNLTGPSGPTYTIADAFAGYATVPGGALSDCTSAPGGCYLMMVAGPRPVQHWDATFTETLSAASIPVAPNTGGLPTKIWTLHVGDSFLDVTTANQFYAFIENLFHNGVTGGCGGGNYCPSNPVTRAQMAVFLLKGEHGGTYAPPACAATMFTDEPCPGGPFVDWVNQLASEGITGGCGGGNYCPSNPVTRAQMAVFLLKAEHGSAYAPPPCTGIFTDVECTPTPAFAVNWIEQLFHESITGGCGGGDYCPTNPNTRGQMAVFLVKTFGLQLYGP